MRTLPFNPNHMLPQEHSEWAGVLGRCELCIIAKKIKYSLLHAVLNQCSSRLNSSVQARGLFALLDLLQLLQPFRKFSQSCACMPAWTISGSTHYLYDQYI